MATLMEKDVLIEAVAQVQAIISRRTAPNAPRNDDQCFLSDLREELYTEDLQPGGINYQVCDFTPGGRFETDINRLCPPADTAVIRAA